MSEPRDDGEQALQSVFLQLVMMLTTSAMQQLGKLVNPATGKAELDRQGAQYTIDLLEMLEQKTQGNLDKIEAAALKDALYTLRMNYVETAAGAAVPAGKPETPPADTASKTPDEGDQPGVKAAADAGQSTGDDAEPRFHKTYG